jgi:hypothetical protein
MVNNVVSINAFSIARILGTIAVLLVLASIIGQVIKHLSGHAEVYEFVWFFYVDAEYNLPSSFSAFLLLLAALILAVITLLVRVQSGSLVSYWMILCLGFFFMAADEILSLHERLIIPVRQLLGTDHYGVFYYAWVIPGIIIVFVAALFFSRFLYHLPEKTRSAFLLSGTLYLGGAIGLELIGGYYDEINGVHNLTYTMIVTAEECLEMTGVILFIRALLLYLADNYKGVRFQFHDKISVSARATSKADRSKVWNFVDDSVER